METIVGWYCHTRAQLGTQVNLSSCKFSTCKLGHEVVLLCSGDPPTHPPGAIISKYFEVPEQSIWGVLNVSGSSLEGFWRLSEGVLMVKKLSGKCAKTVFVPFWEDIFRSYQIMGHALHITCISHIHQSLIATLEVQVEWAKSKD